MNSFFSSSVSCVPVLQQIVRPGRQLGILRDDAELLLVGEDLVAQGVPALVEQCMSLIFLIHSGVGWCGACVPPGT